MRQQHLLDASSELFYLPSNVPALKKHNMSEDPSIKWTHQSINEAQSILVLWELDHPFGDFHNFTHDPTDTWVVHKVKIAARWTLITNPVPAVATCLDFWPCLDTTSKHCIMLHSTETRTACHACLTSILQPFQGLTNSFRSAYVDSCFRAVHKHTHTHNTQQQSSGLSLSCSSGELAPPAHLRTSLGDRVGFTFQSVSHMFLTILGTVVFWPLQAQPLMISRDKLCFCHQRSAKKL